VSQPDDLSPEDAAPLRLQMVMMLRQGGVTDTKLLSAMEQLPREVFMPDAFKARSYENVALPIGHQQTISQPVVVARMTEALNLTDRHKVLEIGTGSGYQAAVLAKMCRRVYTVERHKALSTEAEARFEHLGIRNITTRVGDGSMGWPEQAPFERIMVTAAAVDVPSVLLDQLAVGGVMMLPIGLDEADQQLVRVTRTENGSEMEEMGPTRFVPLVAEEG